VADVGFGELRHGLFVLSSLRAREREGRDAGNFNAARSDIVAGARVSQLFCVRVCAVGWCVCARHTGAHFAQAIYFPCYRDKVCADKECNNHHLG
jgi:hypothetical protein